MSTFFFKHFQIEQVKSAAKVGTDGVLLGAWTPLGHQPQHILDMGAGTGLISLMLAQRTIDSTITAIEIDSAAAGECRNNFLNSPWKERLVCIEKDILNVTLNQCFDLIVSNPPFYTEKTYAPDAQRNKARNTESLDFEILISKASEHLNTNGIFSLIIPYKEEGLICGIAEKYKLYPCSITHLKGNHKTKIKRSLIAFKTEPSHFSPQLLVIEQDRHVYTNEYKDLTKDFYLKF